MRDDKHPSGINRHKAFQFGTNPDSMTAFEKKLARQEVMEREEAQKNYVNGIQGRDGGKFPHQQIPEFSPEYP